MVRLIRPKAKKDVLYIPLSIQVVVPTILRVLMDKIDLEKDLKRIGCSGLKK